MPLPVQREARNETNYNSHRSQVLSTVTACADLTETAVDHSTALANQCRAALSEAARNGWLAHYPQTLLGLRGQPLRSPSNFDNGKAIMNTLTGEAINPNTTNRKYQCVSETTCDRRPATRDEVYHAAGAIDGRLPTQQPQRGIPHNIRSSTVNGYVDAWMSPELYTIDGTRNTIPQTAAKIRSSIPDEILNKQFNACVAAVDGTSKKECTKVGARSSIIDQANNPNVRYSGSEFVGANTLTARPRNNEVGQNQQRRSGY